MFKNYNFNLKLLYWQLLLYGVHVGHSFKNSILYSAWIVLTYKHKILILNLYKTILGFKNGYVGYDYSTKFGHSTWFINLDKSMELYVHSAAKMCGDFAYTTYWIHGMISNWLSIANTMRKLSRYTDYAHKGQFAKLEMESSPWMISRWTWPRSVFIPSVSTTMWPSHECSITGVPSIGIIDTTIAGHLSNIPAPGNDDALDSIVFYVLHIAHYILEKKYKNIIAFYRKIRKSKRITDFNDWILANYLTKIGTLNLSKIVNKIYFRKKKQKIDDDLFKFIKFKNKIITTAWNGLLYFFSKNNINIGWFERLDIYQSETSLDFEEDDLLILKWYVRDYLIYTGKISNFYITESSWRGFKFIKRYNMSNKLFNLRFRTGSYYPKVYHDDFKKTNFFINRICRNRFYKTFLRKSKLRKNKFVCKFLKFYYLKKYLNNKTYLNFFIINFLKVSSFANISFTFGYDFFKKNHFVPLLKYNNNFISIFKKRKINYLYKWFIFKQYPILTLSKIILNNKINNNIKFYYIYKIYTLLNLSLKQKVKYLCGYFNYFLSFWYINKSEVYFLKRSSIRYLNIKYKRLRHMAKMLFYCKIYREAIYSMKFFKSSFFNYNINIFNYNNIVNKDFARYFYITTIMYRKLRLKIPNNWYLSLTITRFKRNFRKIIKYNRRTKYINNVITKLRYYDKFRDGNSREVFNLYRKYVKIPFINKYNASNISKYMLSFRSFLNKYKKRFYTRRIKKILRNKYNINYNHNFYNITKDFYNKTIDLVYNNNAKLIEHNLDYIDLNKTGYLPYKFFNIFHQSNKIYMFRGKYDLKSLKKKSTRNFKNKLLFLKFLYFSKYLKYKKDRGNNLFSFFSKKRNIKSVFYLLNYKLRKLFYLIHNNKFKYWNYSGGNISLKYISDKYWNYKKNIFIMNSGFFFKIWNINLFNYYPINNKNIYIGYNLKNKIIYSYLNYVRFFTIYNKYLFNIKNMIINNFTINHEFRNRKIFIKNNKKNYFWL